MKKILMLIFCSLLLLCSCSTKKNFTPLESGAKVEIIVASDLHYFSPRLTDQKIAFQNIAKPRDGKEVLYIDPLTDAFIEQVIEQNPTALILSGDLTFNGEKQSHEDLAKKLLKVKNHGIAVLVIPGNHDVRSPFARYYKEDKIYYADFIEAAEFKKIYYQFGFSDADSFDEQSLSYFTQLSKDLYILMLDTNLYKNNSQIGAIAGGKVKDSTYAWIETCLEKAKNENAKVISVTHQNLLNHSEVLNEDYTINNSLYLYRMLMDYDVPLNLSGHIHVQDIAKYETPQKTIYDVVTGAMAVFGNQYGVLDFTPQQSIQYHREDINVEAWAKKQKQTDENLLNYEKYSQDYFIETSYTNFLSSMANPSIPFEEQQKLALFKAKLNLNYFSALNMFPDLTEDEGYILWQKYKDLISSGYIESMLKEPLNDPNKLLIPLY